MPERSGRPGRRLETARPRVRENMSVRTEVWGQSVMPDVELR